LGQIMVRTGAGCSTSPRLKLHSIKAFVAVPVQRPHLQEVDCPSIPNILHDMIVCAGSFQVGATYDRTLDGVRIALTTCSRRFEPERCLQDYLKKRFSRPDRLTNLPPFNELPPRMEYPPCYGPLSILELRQTKAWLEIVPIQCFDTPDTISHACVVGGRLVLCFQNFIYVMESLETAMDGVFFREDDPNLITDDWFLDLHTIFVVDDRTCIVSSSGADAVLWVDIPQRKVIRRWRLPAEIYGVNYDLAPGMSLHEHRINNDVQLGHLNCAYPDGNGGCIISTLGQGDVGQVDASGNYKVLASGYVGCHGARYALDRSYIYFVSSCTGQLLRIGERGQIEEMIAVHSKWLQDVEQIKDDIFAFSLADRNEMSIIDVARKVELGRFGFDARGNTTVFVHVLPPRQ
jgi:hypothetical protein